MIYCIDFNPERLKNKLYGVPVDRSYREMRHYSGYNITRKDCESAGLKRIGDAYYLYDDSTSPLISKENERRIYEMQDKLLKITGDF